MVERKTIPVSDDRAINVVTERMADGTWAVVASVRQTTDGAESVQDLPVPTERFASQGEAEAFGVRQAQEWIEQNLPRAA
jgi:hypothetical protein